MRVGFPEGLEFLNCRGDFLLSKEKAQAARVFMLGAACVFFSSLKKSLPQGFFDPIQPLFQKRSRGGDVDPDETRAAHAEPVAAVKGDAALFDEKALEIRSRHFKGPAVEKGNVGPLGADKGYPGKAVGEELLDKIEEFKEEGCTLFT